MWAFQHFNISTFHHFLTDHFHACHFSLELKCLSFEQIWPFFIQKSHTASNAAKPGSDRRRGHNRLNRRRFESRKPNQTRRKRHPSCRTESVRTENERPFRRSNFRRRIGRRGSVPGSESGGDSHRNNPQTNWIALSQTFSNYGFKSNSEFNRFFAFKECWLLPHRMLIVTLFQFDNNFTRYYWNWSKGDWSNLAHFENYENWAKTLGIQMQIQGMKGYFQRLG